MIEDEIDIHTVNIDMAYLELSNDNHSLSSITEIKENIDEMKKSLKKLQEEKKQVMSLVRRLKEMLLAEKKKRNGNETGLDNLLYKVLEKYNIKKQHFHGGAMNGVCCRRRRPG